ncbi:MAG TPA: sulfatase-like hydrolase/transferase [Actinomycetota bacterium]|jgi:arylsulfatase A-like enzyme
MLGLVAAAILMVAVVPKAALAQAITGFSPPKGPVGVQVTISGAGFADATDVQFNGTSASFTVDDDATISATVPQGATTGPITVVTSDGEATSTDAFIVQPNVVLILTDDQRWDEMSFMPKLQAGLTDEGVSFAPNGIISDPLCCPSRATILTGTYSHTNGIYLNNDDGGFHLFTQRGDDQNTIATVLHAQGYRTGLVGKYLNGYSVPYHNYIPPGWDSWFATLDVRENAAYYDWEATDNGTKLHFGSSPASYSTTVFDEQAQAFIDSTPADQPLFLYLAPRAPHSPMTPAPKYAGSLAGLVPNLTDQPNFNEADVSDKPHYVQRLPLLTPHRIQKDQLEYEHQFETLRSVDDMVGHVVDELQADGRLSNTLLIFLSDQGMELGSHRLEGKLVPYEESIRTPFIIRWDALGIAPRTDASVVSNVDLAATIADAAGTTMPGTEGLSLLPLMKDPGMDWRPDVLLEHQGSPSNPGYCGVRSADDVYIQYATGEEELYDLVADPDQLNNQASNPDFLTILKSMRAEDHVLCDPPPPGFVWTH